MKKLSPRKATTTNAICKLNRDNKSFGNADILISEKTVSIWPESKTSDGWIVLKRSEFNRMIDWYNKEQTLKVKK